MDARSGSLEPVENHRRPIGEIFVELGFITRAQLEAALEVQHRTGARIGEILVEQGSLTRLDLASALAEHWEPRSYEDDDPPGVSHRGESGPNEDEAHRGEENRAAISELDERLRAVEGLLQAGQSVQRDAPQGRQLRRRASVTDVMQRRLDEIEDRLAALSPLRMQVGQLQETLDRLSAVRVADAIAVRERLSGSESALATVEGLAPRVHRIEEQIQALATLEQRVGSLVGLVAELEAVAARHASESPAELRDHLLQRMDETARDGHEKVTALVDDLRSEAAAGSAEVEERFRAQAREALALRAAVDTAQADARSVGERVSAEIVELARRLDAQALVADEQARVTERAVRAGLASLGKRLIGPDARYSKPGKGLRRSIDRLGASIVEADARLAGGIPALETEGYVAFVPTPDGYRLVERAGKRPKVGATVELEDGDGSLVVVRHGRSPLPFDGRPCVFLDHT
jgi:hypothetical protein